MAVHAHRRRLSWLVLPLLSLALAGCFGSDDGGDSREGKPRVQPLTRYDMANDCYVMKAADAGHVTQAKDGSYAADAAAASGAEPLFMKPTALGRYLIMARDSRLMAAVSGKVGSASSPSDSSDWIVEASGQGRFTLKLASGKALAVAPESRALVLADQPSVFSFALAEGCTPYPEITVNAEGETFSGTRNGEVLGFADAHVHISATDFLGGSKYGTPFHRFGVTHALKDCKDIHGPSGRLDLIGNLYGNDPLGQHDNQGWPSFASWPAAHSLTHEGMYYKWVERAWKAGLRIMVNELVENEVLCTVNSLLKLKANNCNEMNSVYKQAEMMRSLQDYVDAQEGGPGKGWFRLVTTPAEARKVIAEGKLAVVLGVEISHLFDCKVSYGLLPDLPGIPLPDIPLVAGETPGCSEKSIDEELAMLHSVGVRQLFPVHEFDNALGGNGIFNGLVLNLGNRLDTGRFWQTYDCPEDDYYYSAGAIMTTVPELFNSDDPVTSLLRQLTGGTLPVYKSNKPQCNARGMTPLGRYAIGKMMDHGMIIDLDHLELKMKSEVIEMAKPRNYPLTSTHGGHGGISMAQARDIFNLGGLIYDYKGTGKGFVSGFLKARETHAASGTQHAFAFGFGADTNGMGAQAGPRTGDNVKPVQYPFTLFSGPDWGGEFSKLKPVRFDQQRSGERLYDTDRDGQAHYGLIADWVEEVRIEGGNEALSALYRSAEVYLQMWERALEASKR
ncbi:peptidase M19 [Amnimonas aquatica]|uniref:Peptidase M19 n=1 Tax=Amnimonas aquatica TaxID=2094561 RepID=A0A2P6AT06_9GAMM|nr:peptidase M19 [Amnimonas aquatica]PQA44799.1 peptidase M19 [Amnimonas aquatica]